MSIGARPQRPLLLVDVDGVLCPMGAGCTEEMVEIDGPDYPVRFSARTPRRLEQLAEVFTLVWATNWEERANHVLAPALSLSPLPFVRFADQPGRRGRSHKLAAVRRYVGNQPMAWVDDEVGDDIKDWARKRRAPTLIRAIDPRIGLTDHDVDALVRWVGLGVNLGAP